MIMIFQYTDEGAIKIGDCSNAELELLFEYVKTKCKEGHDIIIKKIDGDYYLSVPICVGAVLDYTDTLIYIHPCITTQPFYFDNLYVPNNIECITFSTEKQQFISTMEIEGCVVDDIDYNQAMYEIIHPDTWSKTEEEKSIFMKEFLQLV